MITVIICDPNGERANDLSDLIKNYMDEKENSPKVKIIIRNENKIILVPTNQGEQMIYVRYLNYINIENRSLSYHLEDQIMKSAHVLRTSFEKTITPYLRNPNLLFIKPSLLINLLNIKTLDRDKIIFKNNEVLYFPKKYYYSIKEKWTEINS